MQKANAGLIYPYTAKRRLGSASRLGRRFRGPDMFSGLR
jgi:hypothetical protein